LIGEFVSQHVSWAENVFAGLVDLLKLPCTRVTTSSPFDSSLRRGARTGAAAGGLEEDFWALPRRAGGSGCTQSQIILDITLIQSKMKKRPHFPNSLPGVPAGRRFSFASAQG
jgi:hypothetical protein